MIGKVSQIQHLNELLRQTQVRQEIISANIANVNTPGYQTQDVQFKNVLNAIQEGKQATPEYFQPAGLLERQDGNNVDIDNQLVQLSKNAMKHQTLAQLISSKLAIYRSAISGRT